MKITKPEISNQYVRVPVAQKQSGDTIRTITISAKQGIKALYAVNRKKIVTYLFSRAKKWTMAKAKAWIKSHKSNKSLINKAMDKNHFKFVLPIIKTRVKITKDKDGNEKEEHYIVGKASSTDKDLVGDKMSPDAIKTMADSIKQHVINLNAEHDTSWLFELGDITKLDITKDFELIFESKLNEMSAAKDLWYALTELNKKLGVSIGGYVKEYEFENEKETEEQIRVFKDIELDHIAIVSEPANPKTWVEAIQKSLKDTELLTNAGKEDSNVKSKLIFKETKMKKKKDSLEAKKLANPETEKKTDKKVEAGTKVEKKTKAEKETKVEKKAKVEKEAKVEKKAKTEKIEKKKVKKSTDKNLSTASWTVNAAKELASAISWLKGNKKDTSKLEAALEEIKSVASDELKEKEEKTKETEVEEAEKKVKKTKAIKKVKASKLVKKAVSKLSKSLEKKFTSIEEGIEGLSKRLETIEEMPEERKGVDISKGIGNESDGGAVEKSEKDLEKALKKVDKKYVNDSDRVFAEKARIRQYYKDNYGIE